MPDKSVGSLGDSYDRVKEDGALKRFFSEKRVTYR